MNVVYLLVHKLRLEDNKPPYYYIGSKYNWKGENTYYSSSRHEIVKNSEVEDLIFTPIWTSEDCSHQELLEKEKEYQVLHDVIENPLFFNQNIANSLLFSKESMEKKIISFKETANKLNEFGVPNKIAWAEKATAVKSERYTKEYLSELGKQRMRKMTESGQTVGEIVRDRMMETQSKVDENGLTGFQKAGKKLSEYLNSVDSSGMKVSQKRIYYGTKVSRIELLGICFFKARDVCELFGFSKEALNNVRKGTCSSDTYSKIENILGAEYLKEYSLIIKNAGSDTTTFICGQAFDSYKEFACLMGVSKSTIDDFVRTKIPKRKLKPAMINYFGKDIFYMYYPKAT